MIKQLSLPTIKELGDMLRWWRSVARYTEGELPPGMFPEGPFHIRLFRTQGPNGTPNDASYPTQTDGDGAELPGKFLNMVYDATASDPCIVEAAPQPSGKTWVCYSPWGWIPRLVDVPVAHISGRLVVLPDVPHIPVRFDAVVTPPNTVTVEVIDYGIADTQTFTANLNLMAGTTNASVVDKEAFTWLNPRLKRWEIIERECS